MTEPANTTAAPAEDRHPASRLIDGGHGAWWSIATLVLGAAALVGSLIRLVTTWDESSFERAADTAGRIAAFLSTVGSTVFVALVVALVVEPRTRRWAMIGAAAFVLSRVLEAILQDHQIANIPG